MKGNHELKEERSRRNR